MNIFCLFRDGPPPRPEPPARPPPPVHQSSIRSADSAFESMGRTPSIDSARIGVPPKRPQQEALTRTSSLKAPPSGQGPLRPGEGSLPPPKSPRLPKTPGIPGLPSVPSLGRVSTPLLLLMTAFVITHYHHGTQPFL